MLDTYPDWDVRKVITSWKFPHDDLISVSAHRGATDDGGTENSYASLAKAAKAGWESVEIDLRLTKDGEVVVLHDAGVGRVTNVPTPLGQVAYNPFTGKGYNPLVRDMDWTGQLENLFLLNHYGNVT